MRTGLIGKKVGMTRFFDDKGNHIPVTVVSLDNQVVSVMTDEKNGYNSVQLGSGLKKEKHTSKALQGHFKKNGVDFKAKIEEFRVSKENLLNVGDVICPTHFAVSQKVDVSSISIGKGFAGGMKRHNFGGLRASHGVSISHRSIGSTGQCQDPGKVFKGKKMPGQMGNKKVTVQGLEVFGVDAELGVVYIKGAVPGRKGSWLSIKDSVKYKISDNVVFPAVLKNGVTEAVSEAEAPVEGE